MSTYRICNFELEIPSTYVSYCHGTPVRMRYAVDHDPEIRVEWTDRTISFTQLGTTVEYDLSAVDGLIADLEETVMTFKTCSLRILFTGPDGERSSLPITTVDRSRSLEFQAMVEEVRTWPLPFIVWYK